MSDYIGYLRRLGDQLADLLRARDPHSSVVQRALKDWDEATSKGSDD